MWIQLLPGGALQDFECLFNRLSEVRAQLGPVLVVLFRPRLLAKEFIQGGHDHP